MVARSQVCILFQNAHELASSCYVRRGTLKIHCPHNVFHRTFQFSSKLSLQTCYYPRLRNIKPSSPFTNLHHTIRFRPQPIPIHKSTRRPSPTPTKAMAKHTKPAVPGYLSSTMSSRSKQRPSIRPASKLKVIENARKITQQAALQLKSAVGASAPSPSLLDSLPQAVLPAPAEPSVDDIAPESVGPALIADDGTQRLPLPSTAPPSIAAKKRTHVIMLVTEET